MSETFKLGPGTYDKAYEPCKCSYFHRAQLENANHIVALLNNIELSDELHTLVDEFNDLGRRAAGIKGE